MLLSCISFSRISDSMSTSLANLHVSQSLLFSLSFFLSPALLFPKPLELIGWSLLRWGSGFRNKCRNGFGQLLAAWYLYIHQIFGKTIGILRHAGAFLSDPVDCPDRCFDFLARRDRSPTATSAWLCVGELWTVVPYSPLPLHFWRALVVRLTLYWTFRIVEPEFEDAYSY